jgi:nicotinamide riboside transporter PnuC
VLSKPIYESLPYVYFAVGYGLITYQPSFFASFSGSLFFIAGALVWTLRSHFRRTDTKFNRQNQQSISRWYELKPFIMFLLAIVLMTWVDHNLVMLLAGVLIILATWILFLRVHNRYSKTNLFSHNNSQNHK